MEAKRGGKVADEKENGDGSLNLKVPKAIWMPIIIGLMSGGGLLGLFGSLSGKNEDEYVKKSDYRQEHFKDSMLYDKRFDAVLDSIGEGNKLIRELKTNQKGNKK